MIDEKEVTAYVTIPDCFLQGCSEDIVIFRADGGNHFTDYGIYEGMFLFFDRKKRFKKGRLWIFFAADFTLSTRRFVLKLPGITARWNEATGMTRSDSIIT